MIVAINPGKCPRSCSLKGGVEIIKHLSYKGRGSPRECRRKKVIAKLRLHIICIYIELFHNKNANTTYKTTGWLK